MHINSYGDTEKGFLSVVEAHKDISFDIERVYWIHGVPSGGTRGGHAHKKTRQLFVCVKGAVWVKTLKYFAFEQYADQVQLFSGDAVLIEPMVWHTMKFAENSILFVLASTHYDESDYIRDYEVWYSMVTK